MASESLADRRLHYGLCRAEIRLCEIASRGLTVSNIKRDKIPPSLNVKPHHSPVGASLSRHATCMLFAKEATRFHLHVERTASLARRGLTGCG